MDTRQPIFAQVMEFLPRYDFQKCVQRYGAPATSPVKRPCHNSPFTLRHAQVNGSLRTGSVEP
jgi:hypothetical protein